jgi:TonB family protein
MRLRFASVLVVLFAPGLAHAQQAAPPATPGTPPEAPTVYYDIPGVTAPVWLHPGFAASSSRHCTELNGTVWLKAIIDANGIPREIHSFKKQGDDLNAFAIGLIAAQRFKPGTYNRTPVPVAVVITTELRVCARHAPGAGGDIDPSDVSLVMVPSVAIGILAPPDDQPDHLAPRSESGPSVYRVGGNISPPVVIHSVEAEFSDYARRRGISGVCIISAIVDVNGIPHHVRLVKSLEPSLDQSAIDAVRGYLFKPAMKDGATPVPVMITIEVDYRLYHR